MRVWRRLDSEIGELAQVLSQSEIYLKNIISGTATILQETNYCSRTKGVKTYNELQQDVRKRCIGLEELHHWVSMWEDFLNTSIPNTHPLLQNNECIPH